MRGKSTLKMPNKPKDKCLSSNSNRLMKVLLSSRLGRTKTQRAEPAENEECTSARSLPYSNLRKLMKTGEEGKYAMSEYINHVSGINKIPDDPIRRDHPYARHAGWRAENYLAIPRRILYSLVPCTKSDNNEDEIDVDTVEEDLAVPYLPSDKQAALPSELYCDTDFKTDELMWAEKISKIGWSAQQQRIFPQVIQLIDEANLPHLIYKGWPKEELLTQAAINRLAAQLERIFGSVSWEKQVMQWLHALLMEKLPGFQKGHYMEILAALRKRAHNLVDRLFAPSHLARSTLPRDTDQSHSLPAKTDKILEILNKEPFSKLPQGPVIVVVPHACEAEKSLRFTFILGQLRQMAQICVVSFKTGSTAISQAVDQMMAETRAKLAEVRTEFSGRNIILMGWNVGAAIACLVAQLEPVRAVIAIGFPHSTLDGLRGEPNDPLLDIMCPVLFIMGERANNARVENVEEMRIRMKVSTQLVIFGSCSDNIVMSHKATVKFGVSQVMVDRSLLFEVYNFIGGILLETPLPPPRVVQSSSESRRTTALKRKFDISEVHDNPPSPKKVKASVASADTSGLVSGSSQTATKQRKPRMSPAQKLMLNSAKYEAELPADYAAKLQQASTSTQGDSTTLSWSTQINSKILTPTSTGTQAPALVPIKISTVQSVGTLSQRSSSVGLPIDVSLKSAPQTKTLKIPGLVISSTAAKSYKRATDSTTKMVQINSKQLQINEARNIQGVSSILISPKSGVSKSIQVITTPTGGNTVIASHVKPIGSLSIVTSPQMTRFLTPTTKPSDVGKVTVITSKQQFITSRTKMGNVAVTLDDSSKSNDLSGHETVTVFPVVCSYAGETSHPLKNTEESQLNVPISLNDELLTPDAILQLPVIIAKDGENIFDLPVNTQKDIDNSSFMIPLDGPCDVTGSTDFIGTNSPSTTNVIVVSPDNSPDNKSIIKAQKKYSRRTNLISAMKYTKVILTNPIKTHPSSGSSDATSSSPTRTHVVDGETQI